MQARAGSPAQAATTASLFVAVMTANLDPPPVPHKRLRFGARRNNSMRLRAIAHSRPNDARAAMSVIHRSEIRPIRFAPAVRLCAVLGMSLEWLMAIMRRRRGRQELARLDDHLLRDIGLTRHDIKRRRKDPLRIGR
jgi:uncharacterized protein YjiS (DUF1127 family)